MNDDELREHLRTALDPVQPDRPDLVRLRRTARRRRRRLQATSAALGLLLVVGTGIGIAAAVTTSGGPGRVTVAPVASPTASAVSHLAIPCVPAPGSSNVRHVTLAVGQTLSLTSCPPGASATELAGGALGIAGSFSYRAERPGTSTVRVQFAMCAVLPATVRPDCFGGVAEVNVDIIVRGSGTTPSQTMGPPPEQAPCQGGRTSVLVGQQLDLVDCPVGITTHVDNPSVLAPGSGPASFTGLKPGTTNVELTVQPVCTPGAMCPRYIRDLGTLVVTVTGR